MKIWLQNIYSKPIDYILEKNINIKLLFRPIYCFEQSTTYAQRTNKR